MGPYIGETIGAWSGPERVSARILGGPTPENDPSMLVPLPYEISKRMAWSDQIFSEVV